MRTVSAFTRYAWTVVGYTVLVILWGAVVRATGSGAGCGRHWPLCNGEVVVRSASFETMIELSHRLTSTFSGFLVIILLVWAYRAFPKGTLVRRGALLSFIFILIEGALGAGLVLLELVEDNASVLRAFAVALHLVNTFVLLMWMVLTAWASHYPNETRFVRNRYATLLNYGLIVTALMSAAGAVTALGDTLFLSGALEAQMGAESAAQHFLVQLRVIHPVFAVSVSGYLFWIGGQILNQNPPPIVSRLVQSVFVLLVVQMLMGVMTIFLRAPIYMQIGHLFFADVLWIILLALTFETLSREFATSKSLSQLQPAIGD